MSVIDKTTTTIHNGHTIRVKVYQSRYSAVRDDSEVWEIKNEDLPVLKGLDGFLGSRLADERGYSVVAFISGSQCERACAS